ncbi:electron transfer flavoprotein beta subunit [Bartonella sp. CDC_skunk]|uniref:Electron transfer flavoprotein subunit beta n=1 Tax=Bartonella rochalimae ATCC BAA-1498 TaxID=685782 RepID=E6YKH8_9HYPH|nr:MULTISPECIES: electron transfer flavoprotein subunit beta/FixA family protein [Bartonella]AQX18781.1 electron transfer flavoprotein beta subunit [Bartonella sp. A1379B]AQX21783.1 electron transfer flavoprotein beta subunit [Bartonella sp. CDC_skunk]AQX23294.1 electron transfer flavoprotein beta subunit [Bartonella sp. 11B]AQX23403.1 electron transfer flavoprotein beta subunit [Bartonella sp. 114]AQX25751.1 electron transfer flavoprotein beta subunit [Bartonella sp. Coyote22sub2]
MKIIVAVKRVIDHNIKIRVKSDSTGVDLSHVKMSMNPFDEIAVEEAIRQKEAGKISEIILVSIGPEAAQETLRTGLAMGADRAILVKTDEILEPLAIAKTLKVIILEEKPDMVFLGKQAIDDECNQTGQMLAGLLGWGQATFASYLNIENGQAQITREVDNGTQTICLPLPMVMTVDLRLNEPRYTSLPNIIKAKKKPIEQKDIAHLCVDTQKRLTTLSVEEPKPRQAGIKVANVTELISALKKTNCI